MEKESSVLIEYLGDHPLLKIIDFLLENRLFDYSKKQIAQGSEIGKVTLFKHWDKLEDVGIVKVTRKFGNTKLYKLNEENPVVKRIIDLELALSDFASRKIFEQEVEA
jgi:nucleoid-associated protein YejK